MLYELIEDWTNSINIIRFIGVNDDVIKVNNNKKSLRSYFINIYLKIGWSVEKTK